MHVMCFYFSFDSLDEILKRGHSRETTEQYFPVVLFFILDKVLLTFESLDEISDIQRKSTE